MFVSFYFSELPADFKLEAFEAFEEQFSDFSIPLLIMERDECGLGYDVLLIFDEELSLQAFRSSDSPVWVVNDFDNKELLDFCLTLK